MLLAVKVMNQTNQIKTRKKKALPRIDPNFFTATLYLHGRKNATEEIRLTANGTGLRATKGSFALAFSL